MHGVMLKHHGCTVEIFERTIERLEGQAAGVATAMNVHKFLSTHDRVTLDLSLPSKGIQELDVQGNVTKQIPTVYKMSTWDALYFRLRANFDDHKSIFVPEPPSRQPGDGETQYHTGRKVVAVRQGADGKVIVKYENLRAVSTETATADLIIGADGANSNIRTMLTTWATGRRYAGYVLWRGIVPENLLSTRTLEQCKPDWFSWFVMPQSREYVVVKIGSLKPGERDMNMAWYSHISSQDLSEALTAIDGHKHKWSVPIGKLSPTAWQKQLHEKGASLNPACAEIASKIERPFLQVIGDHAAPKASFLSGKVLIVGDALVTVRPHAGTAVSSGAFHALELERVLFQSDPEREGRSHEALIAEWESAVLEHSRLERLKSISWGEYYMGGFVGWLPAAIHYYGLLRLKAWRGWFGSFF